MNEEYQTKADCILCIVVLYRIKPDESETLLTLDESCREINVSIPVFLYDNSPAPAFHRDLLESKFGSLKIEYRHDPGNPGLARAYNTGLARAIELGKQWLLILDQDSQVSNDFVEKTIASILSHPEIALHLPFVYSKGRVISPVRLFVGRSLGPAGLHPGINPSTSFFAVNSGTLVGVRYLQGLGGYDEAFSLYFTDNWLCRSFSQSGEPFAITGAPITHDLAVDTSQDKDRILWIYAQGIAGTRRLYANDPITLTVLSCFGFLGAVKRAWIFRDLRFIAVYLRPGSMTSQNASHLQ